MSFTTDPNVTVWNRPGLPAIARRVGTHPTFKAAMLRKLAAAVPELTTRDDDDFTVALLDSWAGVADVLTFYQERFANEAYVRTATERFSILHLARLIGYELRPGVAASAFLAFLTYDPPLGPGRVTIPVGTRVQSVPDAGQTPQTFETIQAIDAQAALNTMRPRMTQPQALTPDSGSVTIRGSDPTLRAGDDLLLVASDERTASLRKIVRVTFDPDAQTTRLDLVPQPPPPPPLALPSRPLGRVVADPTPLTATQLREDVLQRSWSNADLTAQAVIQQWSVADLETGLVNTTRASGDVGGSAFAFRLRSGVYGHTAPRWDSLPSVLRFGEQVTDATGAQTSVEPAFPADWEQRTLADESTGDPGTDSSEPGYGRWLHLDAVYPGMAEDTWIALRGPDRFTVKKIESSVEVVRSFYPLSNRVTRVTLGDAVDLDKLRVRSASVLAQSDPLDLADAPILEPVAGTQLLLDRAYLGLGAGEFVAITGERADLPGVTNTEVVAIAQARLEGGFSQLTFTTPLTYAYVRGTVTCNGNVAQATHGETRTEALGSGDASVPFQRFALRQPPLTYVSASTAGGAQSTLEVRVDDVLWHEVPSLDGHAPGERVYVTRADDAGGTTVQFGDGRTGARVPTGQENIRATYRQGIGLSGMLDANKLTLLATRPAGVRDVTNPLPTSGAADRESRDDARINAPLALLTMGRVVSLQDYQDFATAFAGIARAWAVTVRASSRVGVFLTVAGQKGVAVAPGSPLYTNLVSALRSAGDPTRALFVASYRPALFRLSAKLRVDPDYQVASVLDAAEQCLRSAFAFDARQFGQDVTLSEVAAVLQGVAGVVAVDVDRLYRADRDAGLAARIPSDLPVPFSHVDLVLPAEMLTLDPGPVTLENLP